MLLQFVDQHRALARRDWQGLLLSLVEYVDSEIVELLRFQSDLPAPAALVTQYRNHVSLEREILYAHDLHRRDDPIDGFSRQTNIETDYVFDYQSHRRECRVSEIERSRPAFFTGPVRRSVASR